MSPTRNNSGVVAPWIVKSEEQIADCKVFTVSRMRVHPSGDVEGGSDFFTLRSRDFVNVVAFTESDEVIMVEQWRHGIQAVTLEVPGGIVDGGEDPLEAGVRELREETGFAPAEVSLLGVVHPNPAMQDNRLHAYVATGCRRVGEPEFDDHEFCKVKLFPRAAIQGLLSNGTISHALAVASLQFELIRVLSR